VTQTTQHTGGGLPLTIVDPNGVTTDLTYDARLRPASLTVHTGTGPLTTTYSYDAAGNLIQLTQPDGSATAKTYDSAHRPVAVTDLLNQQIHYTLDALGNRTQTLILDGGSNTTGKHSATFDALGRMRQDIGGVGQTTTYAYDANGNRSNITDPLGRVTTQAHDALNRRVQLTDPAGGVTALAYDAQDHLVKVTDPNSHATSYVYDGFGDTIGTVSPESGNTVFYYDAAGNLVQRLDAAGVVTNYAYDALNRLTSRSYPGNASENVALTYDEAGHGFGVGRLTTVVDNGGVAGSLGRSYDERGNVVSEVRCAGAVTLATAYAYDAADRIAAITYPSGAIASYSRDAMGRVTALAVKPPGMSPLAVTSQIAYQPFGPVGGLVYGNGIAESRAFDLDYRVTGITANGSVAQHLIGYGYDAADNVLAISDNLTGNQSFAYDALNRLTGMSGFYGNLQLGFDAVGNALSVTSGAATETLNYAAGSNRLAAVNLGGNPIRQLSYTPTGNIVSDQQSGKRIDLTYTRSLRA
jgi:YD repeat-containing protein